MVLDARTDRRDVPYRREGQSHRHLGPFFGLAVLIHLALVPLLTPLIPKPDGTTKPMKVALVRVGKNALKKLKQPKRPDVEREKEKRKPEKKEPELTGQIVDIPPSPDDTPPDDAEFLSEHNTRAERQTVSRHQQKDYQNSMNERTVARRQELASKAPSRDRTALEIGPEQEKRSGKKKDAGNQRAFELPDLRQRDRLALDLDSKLGRQMNQAETETLKGNSRRLKLALGEDPNDPTRSGAAPTQAPSVAELMPTIGVLARIAGAPANDHIEGIDEGEGTFLNSREFKYAVYFNRMKRGVSQHWHPMSEYMRRDPSGNIYGQRSRRTILSVTLNAKGDLTGVEVAQSSGLDFLDREAVDAFRRAQPFPNPPQGLVGDQQSFTFPFGFHVDFNRRGGLQLPF
jgi:TonB family protein